MSNDTSPHGLTGRLVSPPEAYGLEETGHDFFIQFTDARPDSGGLSGATSSEAVSWGKVAPEAIPDTIVTYGDMTILLPILAAYAAQKGMRRPLKRLYRTRGDSIEALRREISRQSERQNGNEVG